MRLDNVRHQPSKTTANVPSWVGVKGNGPAERLAGKSDHHKWFVSRKILSVEELESLPAGTKPWSPRHRSPGGDRRIKRKRSMIFLERTSKGHHKSDKYSSSYKGNIGDISETAPPPRLFTASVFYVTTPKEIIIIRSFSLRQSNSEVSTITLRLRLGIENSFTDL